jgi:hypothetical protein
MPGEGGHQRLDQRRLPLRLGGSRSISPAGRRAGLGRSSVMRARVWQGAGGDARAHAPVHSSSG